MKHACPLCTFSTGDIVDLALHIDDDHRADIDRIGVVAVRHSIPIIEVDIDAVHATRDKPKRVRVYVAGPMTGLKDHNYPAFHAEAARLRALGFDAVSPAEINAGMEGEGWASCMRRDLVAIASCDVVCMLPGWQLSKGASLEHRIAVDLGLTVMHAPVAKAAVTA